MLRNQTPIQLHPLNQSKVRHGITYTLDLGPEWVADYEAREAARSIHKSWLEFCEMDYTERCALIAQIRLESMISAHVSDAIIAAQPNPQGLG